MTYQITVILSFFAMLYERIWQSFWPALSVLFLYAALALLNVLSVFGTAGHAFLLAVFFIVFVVVLARFGRTFRFPSLAAIERRMEEQNHLRHRPLTALEDRPVEGLGKDAVGLWRQHVARLQKVKAGLRMVRPLPDTAGQDPYGIRHGALILLVLGGLIAGNTIVERLQNGFQPDIPLAFLHGIENEMDVWIIPPPYTQKPSVFLATSHSGGVITQDHTMVPVGSVLKIRVSGRRRAPKARYARQRQIFERAGERSYLLEFPLVESGTLRLRQGFRSLGTWEIQVIADTLPEINVVKVTATPRGSMKITYTGRDDYTISKVYGLVLPSVEKMSRRGDETVTFDMPAPRHGESHYTIDLSSHVWAGFPAEIILTAEDSSGQTVATPAFSFVLPERKFTNPLAKRMIALRKELLTTEDKEGVFEIAKELAGVANQPNLFDQDIVVFMALGVSARRLVRDGSFNAVRDVQDILWDIALKLEDGGVSVAARDLSESLQKLSNTLADESASDAEVREMMAEVQRKMQEYMRSLSQEMAQRMKKGQNQPQISPEIAQKLMKHIDLDAMMQQLRDMAENNPREAMQKMTEMLRETVDNLDSGRMEEMQESQMQAMQALEDLKNMIQSQQKLMDKTTRLDPDASGSKEGGEQGELRNKLGDIMRKLGEVTQELPDNYPKADQSMKKSQQKLSGGAPKDSIPHQKTTLDELQKGMDETLKKMAEKMQQTLLSFGMMSGNGGGFGKGFDPLGRDQGGESGKRASGEVDIPDEKERRRVQQIIRELRDRSNDFERPKVEREYLDRLLDPLR